MKKLLLASVISVALTGGAGAFEVHDYARSGSWTNYWVRGDNGQLGCGMKVDGSETRSVHVKWFAGQDALQFHLFKDSWRIPKGRTVHVVVGVDGYTLGEADAVGNTVTGHGAPFGTVSFRIGNNDRLNEFLEGFRDAKKLWINFPYGTEQGWSVNMAGSRNALITFNACVQKIAPKSAPQPFGKEPETSQPFGKEPPASSPPSTPAVTGRDRNA